MPSNAACKSGAICLGRGWAPEDVERSDDGTTSICIKHEC